MADAPPPPSSKKQRRKHEKARWLAERKAAATLATGKGLLEGKRRKQRRNRTRASGAQSPTVHYEACTSTTCDNHVAGRNCIIRRIAPYVHRFAVFAKGRWAGCTVRELFAREFPTLSTEYCARAVQSGLVRVNGSETSLDSVIRHGDFLEHFKHRHEPRIHLLVEEVQQAFERTAVSTTWIHFETDEVMVVNKPSGVSVHPSGQFQFNTLTHMLQQDRRAVGGEKEVETLQLFPVHRLDRLTSGLLLLAKTAETARRLTAELTVASSVASAGSRAMQKCYVARVKGAFPEDKVGFAKVAGLTSGLVQIEIATDDFWRVTAPIGLKSPRQGHVRCVTKAGDSKSCVTLLRRRGEVMAGESIVECRLVTGRTHQIRVHLQHLGFPIGNDPLYGSMAQETMPKAVVEHVLASDTSECCTIETTKPSAEPADNHNDNAERCMAACDVCIAENKGTAAINEEQQDPVLWLHSYRYESPSWSFQVPLPFWAFLHKTNDENDARVLAVQNK